MFSPSTQSVAFGVVVGTGLSALFNTVMSNARHRDAVRASWWLPALAGVASMTVEDSRLAMIGTGVLTAASLVFANAHRLI